MCTDFDDVEDILLKRKKWYPLSLVLEYWLSIIHRGRIVAVPKNYGDTPFEGWVGQHPWRLMRFYDGMLDETLDAFNKLVEAVENRLSHNTRLTNDSVEYGLMDVDILQLHEISLDFVREFLRCARRPRIDYIAPGLQVITTSTFSKQPFL